MSIMLTGASGLIGAKVAQLLPPDALQIITRQRVDSKARQVIEPAEKWPAAIAALKLGIAISALGTTRRKAGSDEDFRAVDRDLVVLVAQAALAAGARHFIMVSSVGASAQSKNLYLRTKGEAEDAVKALGFECVDILRPGLLRGVRSGDQRPAEKLAILVSPITDALTPAVLDQYRSIPAQTVAQAIAALTRDSAPGITVHHNRDMAKLAGTW
jgi:uncharacterized protein YbjT (DUF2867 family)